MTDHDRWLILNARLIIAESLAMALCDVLVDRAPDVAGALGMRLRRYAEHATADAPDIVKLDTRATVDAHIARLTAPKPPLRPIDGGRVPLTGIGLGAV